MREIAATSDFDFVASEPAPVARKTQARAQARFRGAKARGKTASGAPPWLSRLWTWRTPMFGGLAFVLLLAAIAVNAMFLQHGHHPAPLMGSTLRIEPAKVEPAPVQQARTQPDAAGLASAEDVLAPVLMARPQAVKPAPVKAAVVPPAPVKTASTAKSNDAIGALLTHEAAAPAVPAKKVAAAQKALIALGAHVEANGQYTAATRKAVEKFQRENGLPVTGELTPKLRHFLALQAGVSED